MKITIRTTESAGSLARVHETELAFEAGDVEGDPALTAAFMAQLWAAMPGAKPEPEPEAMNPAPVIQARAILHRVLDSEDQGGVPDPWASKLATAYDLLCKSLGVKPE